MLRQRNLPVVVIDSDILRQHPEVKLRCFDLWLSVF